MKPLVPEDLRHIQRPPAFTRAALSHARHALSPGQYASVETAAKAAWPTDQVTPIIIRATTVPASSSTAAALLQTALGEFLSSLAAFSAAAALFSIAPRFSIGRLATVNFPRRSAALDATTFSWVDETSAMRSPEDQHRCRRDAGSGAQAHGDHRSQS